MKEEREDGLPAVGGKIVNGLITTGTQSAQKAIASLVDVAVKSVDNSVTTKFWGLVGKKNLLKCTNTYKHPSYILLFSYFVRRGSHYLFQP